MGFGFGLIENLLGLFIHIHQFTTGGASRRNVSQRGGVMVGHDAEIECAKQNVQGLLPALKNGIVSRRVTYAVR